MEKGITFEQKGPNGWSFIIASGFIGVALTIVALALLELALWAGWSMIILAGGQFVFLSCKGASLIIEARGRADGERTRAEALRDRANAWRVIGPEAKKDLRVLWGDVEDGDAW